MTLATTPATAGTPVADWLLPTASDARIRLEKVVMQAKATDERRARPLRALGAVARQALIEEIEAKLRMVMSETLVDLIVGGWRTYAAITQAVRNPQPARCRPSRPPAQPHDHGRPTAQPRHRG